jgi:DUF177 domain-containing protein
VRKKSDYIVQFKGLGLGEHHYNYVAADPFFKLYEESEVLGGNVNVDLTLNKKSNLMELDFRFRGSAKALCDRCLDEVNLPIENEVRLFVKFGDEKEEVSDELIILAENEFEIDLADYIYEFIILSLPARKVHPNDKEGNPACNPEMIKKIEELSIKKESKEIDSRWSKLKDLTKLK